MDLVTEAFAPVVTQFQVGTTYEGRKINALKVQTDPAVSKRAIYVDGLTHAREWITGASILYAFAQVRSQIPQNSFIQYFYNFLQI